MPDVSAPADAHRHLTSIARAPRPAGGAAEEAARRYCASVLEALGCTVTEVPVAYSSFPGRYATPVLGGGMAAIIAAGALLAGGGRGVAALALLITSVLVVAVAGRWLARRGVLVLPVARERSCNLIARRGTPAVWLFAHLDSKSQPVPIAVRAAGLVSLGIVWVAAAALALAASAGHTMGAFGAPIAFASGIAGLPVVLSVVGARSKGARDNASGVATVLCALGELPADAPVGVVLTTAEELGLAGARALAQVETPGIAINVDTVDDAGEISVMYTRHAPMRLVEALTAAGRRRRMPLTVRRLVPGILTDGVALADRGWAVVTISKATMGTLARVHTRADTTEGMTAVGIAETAALVAEAVTSLH